ncbi:Eukaryotic translation initiation factor 2B, subunit 4 delta, 67kDa [Physocladia obscura]|uniref:Translation initiation factor eIF2B subunit delta n=1 Tax=Physocladia obscura TaxID=109957 RepID=A0AAD5TC06_9FUNG|nr:Eukaryotic translation initiation factor 2B, subunit 4 delta, 67kDa [Physocladia obscura]
MSGAKTKGNKKKGNGNSDAVPVEPPRLIPNAQNSQIAPPETSPVGSVASSTAISPINSNSNSSPKRQKQPKEPRSLEASLFSPATAPVIAVASATVVATIPEKKFKDMTPEEQRIFKEKGEAEKLAKKLAKQQQKGGTKQQPQEQQQQQQQQSQKQPKQSSSTSAVATQPNSTNSNSTTTASLNSLGASSNSLLSAQLSTNNTMTPPPLLTTMSSQAANMRAASQIRFDDVRHQKRAVVKGRTLAQKPVALLAHLTQFEKSGMGAARTIQLMDGQQQRNNNMVHPAVIALGVQFSEFIISGGIARCVAMLAAFKRVIADYVTPPGTAIQRNLNSYLSKQIDHLTTTRGLAQTMKFAIRQLKSEISNMSIEISDEDTKVHLLHSIDTFIKERIVSAHESIVEKALEKVKHGDVILTFGRSAVVERLLIEAAERKIDFRVIISDARPKLEGKVLLRRLVALGVNCTYVLVTSLGAVMSNVTKVIIGASALLSNGALLSRTGTAIVAMMAYDAHIPVMVLCELIKFSELVQLDSFVWNEIGDPDELVNIKTQSPANVLPSVLTPPNQENNSQSKQPILKEWRDIPDLKLLNLHYDITPAHFISLVVCENGCIPSTSVLSVVTNMKLEEEKNLKKTTLIR